MQLVLALVIGGLFSAGVYMMLRRNLLKLLIGLGLLSHAVNLLIFTASRLVRGSAPIVDPQRTGTPQADPLPQALILTAIVISFGVIAFAVSLVHRTHLLIGADDLDEISKAEKL